MEYVLQTLESLKGRAHVALMGCGPLSLPGPTAKLEAAGLGLPPSVASAEATCLASLALLLQKHGYV